MQTSTPLLCTKSANNSIRTSGLSQDVTKKLYQNTWNQFRDQENLSPYDIIEAPNFVDFEQGSIEVRDSFFDGRNSYCPLPQEKERLALPANSDEPIDVIESLKTCTISETDNVTSDHEDTTMTGECTLTNDPSEAPATPIKSNTSTRPLSQHIVTNNLETHTTPRKSSVSNPTVPKEVVIAHPETYRTPKKAETSVRRLSVYNNLLTPIRKLEIVVEACEPPDHHPQSQGTPKKPETPGRRMSIQNSGGLGTPRASDASERRLSQVQPFSFEQREKENQEMREFRREYYKNLADKMNNQSFKAKPAPKFTQSRGNPAVESPQRKVIRVPRKTESKIAEKSDKSKISASLPKKTQPLKASNILKPANMPRQPAAPKPMNAPKPANIPPALKTKAKSTSSLAQTQKPTASFAVSKIFKQNSATVTGNFPKFNTQKKPKLFQPVVPHRKLELPKVPELLTAKRARERQQFEERLREREREKEEARKKEEAIQKAKEQEEIANMRKATVFKARPVPQYRNVLPQVPKRPLTEPMFPIWTKRRRCL